MWKKILPILLILSISAFAGTTGKVAGRVYDAQNGQGLPGVNVMVEGTGLGAATDADGYFVILDVPPGTYKLTATMIGYKSLTVEDVKVLTDLTTTINFPLTSTVVQMKQGVVVKAERPIIQKDVTTSVAIVDAKQMKNMPVNNIQGVVAQQAGVVSGGGRYTGGIHIRGGRGTEVVYMVDGIELKDPISGAYDTHIPQMSVQETSVYSGGFGAEYGDAQSGVINIVTKEGRNRLSMMISGRMGVFDSPFIDYLYSEDTLNPNVDTVKHYQGYKRMDYTLSLPVIKPIRLFISGEIDTTLGRFPHQDAKTMSNFGKLTYKITNKMKTSLEGMFVKNDYHQYFTQWKYVLNHLPDNNARSNMGVFRFTYSPSAKSFLKVVYGRYQTSLHRNVFEDGYTDINNDSFINPTNHDSTVNVGIDPNTGDTIWRTYPSDLDSIDDFADVDEDGNVEIDGVEDTLYWPDLNYPISRARDNRGYYRDGYYRIAWHYDESTIHTFKIDYTNQVTKHHYIRTGLQFKKYDLFYYTADMASGGNFYMERYSVNPYGGAVFINDKMEFQGLIVNGGFRFDLFNANSEIPADPYHPVTDITTGGTILNPVKTTWKYHLSPRLGVSHPISANDKLHFSYGHYFQIPQLSLLYRNMNYDLSGAFSMVGNPNLSPEKTVSYEVGIEHALPDVSMLFDVTTFYKDITGLTDTEAIFYSAANYYTKYRNADYGNVKGYEMTFKKLHGGIWSHWAWSLIYTYSIARGKSSSTRQNYNFIWSGWVVPTSEHYLDWDQRHTVSFNLDFAVPTGENLFSVRGLDNVGMNLLFNYGSGLPWTPPSRSVIQHINEGRLPYTMNIDMKLRKDFTVASILNVEVYTLVTNLTNKKNLRYLADENWYSAFLADSGFVFAAEGQYKDKTVWSDGRRIRVGIEIKF